VDKRLVVVESSRHISIENGRLKFMDGDTEARYVLPTDVAVICIDAPHAIVTSRAISAVVCAGAAIVHCDDRHLPCGVTLPMQQHGYTTERLIQQFSCRDRVANASSWRRLIQSKLRMQACALRLHGRKGALRLERLAELEPDASPTAAESQGARHYFRYLFDGGFRRRKEGAEDPINVRLNYGYAVLRALVARQLAAGGLNLALGVGHSNMTNPMNLADDFMEPFRPLVDDSVWRIWKAGRIEADFKGAEKRATLDWMSSEVFVDDEWVRVSQAIKLLVDSYIRAIAGPRPSQLAVPEVFRAASSV